MPKRPVSTYRLFSYSQMFPDISFYDFGNQRIFGVAGFKYLNPGQETLIKKLENDHVTPK